MRRSWFRTVMVLMLLAVFLGSSYSLAHGNLEQRLDQTRRQLDSARQQTEKTRKQVRDVSSEIAVIDSAINIRQKRIDELTVILQEVEARLQEAEADLADAENRLDNMNEVFATRVRSAYENGNVSYLEVLLGAQNFSDLVTRVEFIREIMAWDRALIEEIQEERAQMERRKAAIEERRQEIQVVRHEQEKAYRALNTKQQEKESLLAVARGNLGQLQATVDKLEREENELLTQIARQRAGSEVLHTGKFLWPVPNYTRVTSDFGMRQHPILGAQRFHNGIDIAAPHGVPVVAAGTGRVAYVGSLRGYGNVVILDHGGNVTTLYAHLSTMAVREGQLVVYGETIARIGSTGMSTGPHLHFTVQENGNAVSPWKYLR